MIVMKARRDISGKQIESTWSFVRAIAAGSLSVCGSALDRRLR
jgi:hypothetical protein